MRPLFDKAFGQEIQVIPTVISSDMNNTPDIVAINAASCAVTISIFLLTARSPRFG